MGEFPLVKLGELTIRVTRSFVPNGEISSALVTLSPAEDCSYGYFGNLDVAKGVLRPFVEIKTAYRQNFEIYRLSTDKMLGVQIVDS
jgi:hypothetical protein